MRYTILGPLASPLRFQMFWNGCLSAAFKICDEKKLNPSKSERLARHFYRILCQLCQSSCTHLRGHGRARSRAVDKSDLHCIHDAKIAKMFSFYSSQDSR